MFANPSNNETFRASGVPQTVSKYSTIARTTRQAIAEEALLRSKIFTTQESDTWHLPSAKDISRGESESTKKDPRPDLDRSQLRENATRDMYHRLKALAERRNGRRGESCLTQDRLQIKATTGLLQSSDKEGKSLR